MTARVATSRFLWSTPLDNCEPPRAYSHGIGDVYPADETHAETVMLASSDFPFTLNCIFLLDDGVTVRPFYVAGMPPYGGAVHIQPFVPDRGWAVGPRRAYHLKIQAES